jgi:hypothetical protein
MNETPIPDQGIDIVLVVESEVLVRHALAEYLRHCGYRFGLSRWVRENRAGVQVILSGSVIKAAHAAGDLCEEGPHLTKPYEPQQVVEWIKKLRNLKG